MAHLSAPSSELLSTSDLQRSIPAPFLTKTYQLVDDSATDDIVSWNECGSAFVIWRPLEFARDLLPNYFKHNNFSSFVRQLNTYGFKKMVPDRWEFANEFFKKGERHLLIDIHRRKTVQMVPIIALPTKRPVSPSNSADEQAVSSSSSPLSSPRERTTSTHPDETERLKKENMLLTAEVSCLRQLCTDLILYIQKHARGPGQDLSCIRRVFDSSSSLPCSELAVNDGGFLEQAAGNGGLELRAERHEETSHLHEESPCRKGFSSSESSSKRDPPMLFGVPLPCRRRRCLDSEEHSNKSI